MLAEFRICDRWQLLTPFQQYLQVSFTKIKFSTTEVEK